MKKYTRPISFSDPGYDFEPQELSDIINKKDEELDIKDFMSIFQIYLPAGNYEECVYFVEVFLAFLQDKISREIDRSGLSDALFHFLFWCNDNIVKLRNDNIEKSIITCLQSNIIPIFDRFDLIKHGGPDLWPRYGTLVSEFVTGVNDYAFLNSLKEQMVQKLSSDRSFTNASWVIYICFSARHDTNGVEISGIWGREELITCLNIVTKAKNIFWDSPYIKYLLDKWRETVHLPEN